MENKTTEKETPLTIDERDIFRQLGFDDEKDYKKYNSRARALWKSSHKQCSYDDELTPNESRILMKDVEITQKAKLMKTTEIELIAMVENKVKQIRNGTYGKNPSEPTDNTTNEENKGE